MTKQELDVLNKEAREYADKKADKVGSDYWKGLLQGYLDCNIAVKNCSIPAVVGRSEQLCDYCKKPLENTCCNDCLEEMDNHNQ